MYQGHIQKSFIYITTYMVIKTIAFRDHFRFW